MQHIPKRQVFISSVVALLTLFSLGVSIALGGSNAHAAAQVAPAVHNPLLNVTANEDDITDPTVAAAPAALCATYTSNPYAKPAPNVDMINGDTTVAVGTQTGCKAAQNETTIVVNPENPRNIVGGTNDYRVFNSREDRNDSSGWAYTSFDGGKTWLNVELPHLTYQTGATGVLSDMDSAGDPSLSFGPDNTVYYANLVFSRLNDASGIAVSISHNGGRTWGEPSIVHTDGVDAAGNPLATGVFNDKDWITVDPRDSRTAYVSWTDFTTDSAGNGISPIVLSVTHNGGASWSTPVQVTPAFVPGGITPYDQGSIPLVDNHGALEIAYEGAVCQTMACSAATDHDTVIVAKSVNGGRTFTNTQVSIDYDFPYNLHTDEDTLTGENFRINSFPQMAIDRATGQLYVTWADDRNGQYDASGNSIQTNGDVLVATSRDGTHWYNQVTVGSTADEVFPAVAAIDGRVVVSYYTRAYDASGIGLDYAYSKLYGPDLGDGKLVRITGQSENPQVQFVAADLENPDNYLQGVFIGDYTAIAVGSDGVFHPSWTDFRGDPGKTLPNQDAYTQSIKG